MSHTLYRNFFATCFGKAKSITITNNAIILIDSNLNTKEILIAQLVDFPVIEQSFLSTSLIIKAKVNIGLSDSNSNRNNESVEVSKIWGISRASVSYFNNKIKERLYHLIGQKITQQADSFHQKAIAQYLRDSSIAPLQQSVSPLIASYRAEKLRWQQILSPQQLSKIDIIARMPAITEVKHYRHYFEKKALTNQAEFFDGIESNPLTQEQRLAVIRNNDKNLVLAAAGTGKTSVMVAKALSLIIYQKIPADKVLILAYNNAAAKELEQRITLRKKAFGINCQSPKVMTFHALGLQILTKVGVNTRLSSFANDSHQLSQWLTHWLLDYIRHNSSNLHAFLAFALPPDDSNDADKHLDAKNKIAGLISDRDIDTSMGSVDKIINELVSSGLFTSNVQRLMKCLQVITGEQLTGDQIHVRYDNVNVNNGAQYTMLLTDIYQGYQSQLASQGAIDFDDMIFNALEQINNGRFTPIWTDILVDEFQDISTARMKLLNTIIEQGPQPRLTAVGDDWQSIYRFSGGKLALITQFEQYFGSHCLTTLQKTFRYNNSIAQTAGQFVMQNPEQYRKSIEAHHQVTKSQVFLLHSGKSATIAGINQVIRDIRAKDKIGSIAILARYRHLLNDAKQQVDTPEKLHFWTFHSAKGLESEYCIIVGLYSGKSGFPSDNKTDLLIDALLPQLDGYKYSEERRLLYVAITRAKKQAYLIADAHQPSQFIEELVLPQYQVNILSAEFDSLKQTRIK